MGNRKINSLKFVALIFFAFILFQVTSYGQNCPSFKIEKIVNTGDGVEKGSIEVVINSSKRYSNKNFDIRQKENQVTGPLGYDVEIAISKNELIVSGLKKSQEMYLSEYIILFSDKSCNQGKLMEVGPFKIK
jgi:hypothetical protein